METEADLVLRQRAKQNPTARAEAEEEANAARLRQEAALRAKITELIPPLLEQLKQREYRDMCLRLIGDEAKHVAVYPFAQSEYKSGGHLVAVTQYYLRGDGNITTTSSPVNLAFLHLDALQAIAQGLEDARRKLQ